MVDNPLILANRKAKRLAGLLKATTALKGKLAPFVEELVFLSHKEAKTDFRGPAGTRVFLRAAGPGNDRNLADYIEPSGNGINIKIDGLSRDKLYFKDAVTTETIPGTGQKRKIKLAERRGALETLAKHLGMLIERRDITTGGMPLTSLVGDVEDDELDRRIAAAESRKAQKTLQS